MQSANNANKSPDLRILALADSKLLPPEIQAAFDHWRIWKARDAVATTVRKRITNMGHHFNQGDTSPLHIYLERLEAADTEQTIFEGIYAISEAVEVHRKQLGLHSEYIVLIMSGHLKPYELLELQGDFENPPAGVIAAAEELWRLAREHEYDVNVALKQIKNDELLVKLDVHYAGA